MERVTKQVGPMTGGLKRAIPMARVSKKHRRTLMAIFAEPVRANVNWSNIEALLEACGAELSQGRGSRVRIALNGVRAVFHRPHPHKETDKGALSSMRR